MSGQTSPFRKLTQTAPAGIASKLADTGIAADVAS